MTDVPAAGNAKPWLERLGFVTASRDGVKAAASAGWGDIKNIVGREGVTWGQRGVGFARVGGIGVGAAMAGDALFRGKTSDGEDRSMLARLGEFVLGTGIAATSLLRGGR